MTNTTTYAQAVKTVATLVVEQDSRMLPVVNGLLSIFGYPTLGDKVAPASRPAPQSEASAFKAAPVPTPAKTTEKEQRSGLFVVDSTSIDTLEYKAGRRHDARRPHLKRTKSVLTVTFVNGSVYDYKGVSQRTFDNLMASDSKGRFFNEEIKGQYPTTRIK
jgi:hypothetical protein